jgi:N-acetylglucosamine kinase-like BadF-type ATPase
MQHEIPVSDASYFLGFDGGGTKTDCVLADAEGQVLARAFAGPSNPIRAGYARTWFSLGEAADRVLAQKKIRAGHIRAICAGLGGASSTTAVRSVTSFFKRGYPNALVHLTTDLEMALEAAFGAGEGIVLMAGTGSAAFGRDADGRTARAGGRGPWFSDEGSAFDIGRRAMGAAIRAEEHRGPSTELAKRIFEWHQARDWDALLDQAAKRPDEVFPKTFPLVAQLADDGDAVACGILKDAAVSLAQLAGSVVNGLGWHDRQAQVAKVGGVYGRSKFFDAAIEAELKKVVPRAHFVPAKMSPAEAAVQMGIRLSRAQGNAA